jgi:hypothetical protein
MHNIVIESSGKSFLRGIARVGNPFATSRASVFLERIKNSYIKDDEVALYGDWKAVGDAITTATKRFEQSPEFRNAITSSRQ